MNQRDPSRRKLQVSAGFQKRHRRGITLVELLLAMTLAAVIALALGYAFAAGLDMRRSIAARSANLDRTDAVKRRISEMLTSAWLSSSTTDKTTFFVGNSSSGSTSNGTTGCDTLTFTTTAPDIPLSIQNSDDDFATQQQNNGGPIGGMAEVAYSTTAIGDSGNHTGLFERVQRPSDSDPTQGGMQTVLDPDIDSIGFQFWDGLEWVTGWDTTTGTASLHHLPSAVMVSYTLKNSRDKSVQMFIVPIRNSDVTPLKPVSGQGGNQ